MEFGGKIIPDLLNQGLFNGSDAIEQVIDMSTLILH
jgi:hypothetical protein